MEDREECKKIIDVYISAKKLQRSLERNFFDGGLVDFSYFFNDCWKRIARILLIIVVPFMRIDEQNFFEIGIGLENFRMRCNDGSSGSFFDFPSMEIFFILCICRNQMKSVWGCSSRIWEHIETTSIIRKNNQRLFSRCEPFGFLLSEQEGLDFHRDKIFDY